MPKFFLEVSYRGTAYSGFQVQENANSIQAEIEKALALLHRFPFSLTGSSRTDAGVHALQNYFHFDAATIHPQTVYKLNAILPKDISVRRIDQMPDDAHSRFDAVSREYEYHIHQFKDPFQNGLSYYYPYHLNLDLLQEAAALIKTYSDFSSFAKSNSQVKNFQCIIYNSEWHVNKETLIYHIKGNRFLRGMVRLITGSLLKVGRGKMSLDHFRMMIQNRSKAGFSVPADGLYLKAVNYPENYFP
ncbi:MAG TPA: tRNA pseudouridine(38-40) synthase TruA [Flavisolibacter sp.]|nr:tRNA pseudouridine(38-40) synthase TruA [Flavisolibacter sp.]